MIRIVLSGGGTGGHITPLLAVAHKLKQQSPDCHIIYVGERNGKYVSMLEGNQDIDEFRSIFAGKFRRYYGESWTKRITDFRTIILNARDLVYLVIGFVQSIYLVRKLNPSVVLLKGGFVGVPVGLASALWKKPIITHDSDALPGLANRIVSKWAKVHATAMPAEYYSYRQESVKQVGVLVSEKYQKTNNTSKEKYRFELGIPKDSLVLMVTGGSNGAQVINEAVSKIAGKLLSEFSDLYIIHQVGKGKQDVYREFSHKRLIIRELLEDMYKYSCSADLIVTRAGANTIAEFGVQAKPCIVIPNPRLTGGHQTLNAKYLNSESAALVLEEASLMDDKDNVLYEAVTKLLTDNKLRVRYGERLNAITINDATDQLATIILELAKVHDK